MNNENKITYISVERLHPHPDNPRKNIGDIAELTDSVRENGIYQNLTVVPSTGYYYGDYTVIIGHRRLAAAKAAGLAEVPCVITEMSTKEQLSTMLLENMQRSDLTTLEQAQGMQLMLDMGETVSGIAQKTGLSENTVRRRVRLCSLDSEKMQKVQCRQIDITDYDRLFELQSPERRNSLLESIGTRDFEFRLKSEKSAEERESKINELLTALKRYYPEAEELKDRSNLAALKFDYWSDVSKNLELYGKIRYSISNCGLYLYSDYSPEELEQQDLRQREFNASNAKRKAKKSVCDAVYNNALELRMAFFRELKPQISGKSLQAINQIVTAAMFDIQDKPFDGLLYSELYTKVTYDEVSHPLTRNQIYDEYGFLKLAYAAVEKACTKNKTYDLDGEYRSNERLESLYACMQLLGYVMSNEETEMLKGTHDMYFTEVK